MAVIRPVGIVGVGLPKPHMMYTTEENDKRGAPLLEAFKRVNPEVCRSRSGLYNQKTLLSGQQNLRADGVDLPRSFFDHTERWYFKGDSKSVFALSLIHI